MKDKMMDNYLNKIKNKIKEKKVAIGTHISLKENTITEMMGDAGFDFVWIDMEHSAIDKELVQDHLIACRASGMASFVRIPWNDPILVKPILEMNPAAVIFPFIMNAEETKRAVESCKYPPKGKRGFGPKRAIDYGLMSLEEYVKDADTNIWIIVQIEHIEAVKKLDEILKIDGIDGVVAGPNDLSASIGLLGKTRHVKVKKLMDEIACKANSHNKPLGASIGYNLEDIEDWVKRGASWMTVGTTEGYLIEGAKKTIKDTKELISKYK